MTDFAFRRGSRITAAAYRVGRVLYTSPTHHFEAYAKADRDYPGEGYGNPMARNSVGEGFITNTGRFVDRKEAGKIANKAKQIRDDLDYRLDKHDLHWGELK